MNVEEPRCRIMCHCYVSYVSLAFVLRLTVTTSTSSSSTCTSSTSLFHVLVLIVFGTDCERYFLMEYYKQAAGPSPVSYEPFSLGEHAPELDVKWTSIVADPSNARRVIDIYDIQPVEGSVNRCGDSYLVSFSNY